MNVSAAAVLLGTSTWACCGLALFTVLIVTAARIRGWPLTGRDCRGWSRAGWGCGYEPEPLGPTMAAYSGS